METLKKIKSIVFSTVSDKRSVLPRLIVGLVFLSEGIQKYLLPDLVGVGRFEKIGFADPAFWAYFVATFEIICSLFVLIGLAVRLAAVPLFIVMMTALVTTKIPILIEKGFWSMAHAARTDFAMTLLLVFLFIYGAGRWSVDAKIYSDKKSIAA